MKDISILKPDRQGRITLPHVLRDADLVSYEINEDGSVLFFPAQAVRAYPDMSNLPETDDLPESMKAALLTSLKSKEKGLYAGPVKSRRRGLKKK